ncbi:response regulator [Tamlana sp. 2_MG-2023]|uniref:response regulator n=1 Tax=unclassified Tamlana TaxID=2614803 RepID=UPI0026E36F85|nr:MULTISPECIES: response regulator [unclassified Tamlana]MDO6760205.1 response regulator [Tamlana sp. 2_MG-2023]MDO6790097.1 response regulator [Tamlana sp. 1_MG-2023]
MNLPEQLLVYLADDDEDDRLLFVEAFENIQSSIQVVTFDNGVTLMDNLLNPSKPGPHAIYLDLNMPLMNGIECLNDIKLEEKLRDIPVFIYSNNIDISVVDELQKKGANLYIQKPNSYEKLIDVLHKSLKHLKSGNAPIPNHKFILIDEYK